MRNAKLNRAKLKRVSFIDALMSNSKLEYCEMTGVLFTRADIKQASFNNVRFYDHFTPNQVNSRNASFYGVIPYYDALPTFKDVDYIFEEGTGLTIEEKNKRITCNFSGIVSHAFK